MSFQYSPYAIPLFLAAALCGALAFYSLRQRQHAEARTFGLMVLALGWWSLCYGLHICGANLETQYFFNSIKYLGVIAVPPLWLVLALQYTEHDQFLTRRNLALIFLPAVILLSVMLTNRWTGLWWPRVWLGQFNGYPVFRRTHGLFYYIHALFGYLYIVLGLVLYIRFYRRTAAIYRSQSMLMVIAAGIPLGASALTQLGFSPLPWGMDPFFFVISSGLIALAIFRYRFLDILPVARRIVVEQMPEGIVVLDPARRIIDANPKAQEILSNPGTLLIGQPLRDAVQVPALRQALIELTQSPTPTNRSRDVQLQDQVLTLETTPLIEADGSSMGQIIHLRDITERVAAQRRAEALYRQAEIERERLALTISTTADAVVLLDANGEILAQNPAAQLLLRATRLDEFPPLLQNLLNQAQSESRLLKTEIDLDMRSFDLVITPIANTGLVLTMHDVTHFKQLAHLKDEFVATVSHDLRAPLTSIIGYTQMAQQSSTPENKRTKALKRIESSAWRMAELINNMLDLANLEAGVDLDLMPTHLDELARIAAEDLGGAALAKGLTLRYELDSHVTIQADPQRILQVWRNLLDNAIKYTDRGTITLRVEEMGSQVIAQVIDTGPGISPTDIPYVFDKFFRAKHSPSPQQEGSGLGLSLVKTIIERHGSKVWVESVVGVGSTFTFILPRQQDTVR